MRSQQEISVELNYFSADSDPAQFHVTRRDGRVRPSSRAKLGNLTKYATRRMKNEYIKWCNPPLST